MECPVLIWYGMSGTDRGHVATRCLERGVGVPQNHEKVPRETMSMTPRIDSTEPPDFCANFGRVFGATCCVTWIANALDPGRPRAVLVHSAVTWRVPWMLIPLIRTWHNLALMPLIRAGGDVVQTGGKRQRGVPCRDPPSAAQPRYVLPVRHRPYPGRRTRYPLSTLPVLYPWYSYFTPGTHYRAGPSVPVVQTGCEARLS
eukprot:185077-Rhodomonas_salina.1